MVKFKISAERFQEVCTVPEYIGVLMGGVGSQMAALPKMLLDDNGNYIVKVIVDEDGDIKEYQNLSDANKRMDDANISITRLAKLGKELTEAARNIVNPPKGGSLTKPTPPSE